METKHSKGAWKIGIPGTVITDNNEGFPADQNGHNNTEYYGGTLICESILKKEDAQLISAAPDLLDALIELKRWANSLPDAGSAPFVKVDQAIEKATGMSLIKKSDQNPFYKEWPESSMVYSTEYVPSHKHLDITLKNGGAYRYYDVPETEWNDLESTNSIGSYVNKKIKGTYQSQSLKNVQKDTSSSNETGL